jgi:hypothetical protein
MNNDAFEFDVLVGPTPAVASLKTFWLALACLLYVSTNLASIPALIEQRQANVRSRVLASVPAEPAMDPVTKQVIMDLEFISKWATFGQTRGF